ncbi:prephenate dehydratase [Aristaeella lactis]|uniref:Chorismate mutase / prephenate dehydratase n=1 Tax=Aristaeella lactis TaxID=3046383 RepID=A0AC61PN51_9FIRM|nr:prephenate dehydratase [Aristaeella lactis]QUA52835.1 prephenate dehydratase [Aristaeella lactis]SMC74134.1 chorismate mutase / prephenate dehydratase [Aristaeella lactis]
MTIEELRARIDRIDSGLIRLYAERLETAAEIGKYKQEHNLPVFDPAREREVLNKVGAEAGEANENGVRALFSFLMAQSRTSQMLDRKQESELGKLIRRSVEETPKLFPEKAKVACQGVEGAYSQQACEKMFRSPAITYCKTFGDVFSAIESGECEYGVLPIENSLAGSVNSVYDKLLSRKCYIVRSARVKIDHTLLVKPGTKPEDIREIWSHEQAIQQCSDFLSKNKQWQVNVSSNTAAAARMVAESGRKDVAAISSGRCAQLYGLEILKTDIQNNSNNHTRFICISRKPEIYPGADRTSLMLALPDRPGALYQLLGRFNAQGINLTKLESRPVPGKDFEFMFCFDIDASVYSPAFTRLIEELDVTLEKCVYLGSYSELA